MRHKQNYTRQKQKGIKPLPDVFSFEIQPFLCDFYSSIYLNLAFLINLAYNVVLICSILNLLTGGLHYEPLKI
jgi:hypothetical protein